MQAVILVGGLGTRLRPFTKVIPKPLLPIGEKSVLQIQISRLKEYGFKDIFLATGYKSEYIKSFFGDGSVLGVNLTISKEEKPLGTCGPLTLLKEKLKSPFIVINGDILTTIDFGKLYKYALDVKSDLVVVTKKIRTPFDFGNVKTKGNFIIDVKEKPIYEIEIIAGIYVLKTGIFKYIPVNEYYGMDQLIKNLLKDNLPVARYLMQEYWLDIGRVGDYKMAQDIYEKHFANNKEVIK